MTLSSTFGIINSAFASTAAQSAVISSNISNVNTPGYVRELANQITTSYGGSEVVSVTRQANSALLDQLNASTSESAAQTAISTGLSTLAQTVDDSASATTSTGALQNGDSPSAMLANLESALTTYAATPSSTAAGQAVLTAAQDLTSSLNAGSAAVQQVRQQADLDMASSVSTINSLLNQFTSANNSVVQGLAAGTNVTQAEDTRDSILTQLSQQVGISTTTNLNGSMSIYTDSGVTLFQDVPQTGQLYREPDPGRRVDRQCGHRRRHPDHRLLRADGDPVRRAGRLCPAARHDRARISVAARSDRRRRGQRLRRDRPVGDADTTRAAGPLHLSRRDRRARRHRRHGSGGGDRGQSQRRPEPGRRHRSPARRRDLRSRQSRLHLQHDGIGELQRPHSADDQRDKLDPVVQPGGGSGFARTAFPTTPAIRSAGCKARARPASDNANYQSSLVSQASGALSNATGVNLDTEMTNMLNIENSYTTSAKLLTTVNAMFSALINAA